MEIQKNHKKKIFTRTGVERTTYLILIVALVIYGFRDSAAAVSLIEAVKQAFSLLLNSTP